MNELRENDMRMILGNFGLTMDGSREEVWLRLNQHLVDNFSKTVEDFHPGEIENLSKKAMTNRVNEAAREGFYGGRSHATNK